MDDKRKPRWGTFPQFIVLMVVLWYFLGPHVPLALFLYGGFLIFAVGFALRSHRAELEKPLPPPSYEWLRWKLFFWAAELQRQRQKRDGWE